jgi:isopenicillin-N N-acyltransferase-like protein
MSKLTRLITTGTPAEVGTAHGAMFASEIRQYADTRIALSAVGTDLDRAGILDVASRMLDAHECYDADLFLEMSAMADAAGISQEEAVIVGGYTDFIDTVRAHAGGTAFEDSCTAVMTTDIQSDGAGFLGQTWDMDASATPHVFMLDITANDDPRALIFTTHGTLGQIGMNTAGIAIGINNLTVTDGALGVTWPFVVRKALRQVRFEAALACIIEAPLAGGHNFMLFDAEGNGASIEATPTTQYVEHLETDPLVHTNHCIVPRTAIVEAERPESLVRSSADRIEQATELLAERPHSVDQLISLFADERSICRHRDPVFSYESAGAAIMRPATGDFWACWGIPSENRYERFSLRQIQAVR